MKKNPHTILILKQWFSDFSMYQKHQPDYSVPSLISGTFPDDAVVAGLGTALLRTTKASSRNTKL